MNYGAILADPPWYWRPWSNKGAGRNASNHYQTLDLNEIMHLQPQAADDCALFLWATDPMLPEALELIKAWGFKYKTVAFTWVKCKGKQDRLFYDEPDSHMGMGYWTRSNPEHCLFATRGKPKRLSKSVRQLIMSPRREHSRKPDEVYDRVEQLVKGPYLEMFARTTRPGWAQFGNEVGKFDECTA